MSGRAMAIVGGMPGAVWLRVPIAAQRGGSNFVGDKPDEMQIINAKLDGDDTLTSDSYLQMDLISVGLITYIGNRDEVKGRFSPYVAGRAVYADWALLDTGRDGTALS